MIMLYKGSHAWTKWTKKDGVRMPSGIAVEEKPVGINFLAEPMKQLVNTMLNFEKENRPDINQVVRVLKDFSI